jgi:hypothetical protein
MPVALTDLQLEWVLKGGAPRRIPARGCRCPAHGIRADQCRRSVPRSPKRKAGDGSSGTPGTMIIDRGDRSHAGFAFNGCTTTFVTVSLQG